MTRCSCWMQECFVTKIKLLWDDYVVVFDMSQQQVDDFFEYFANSAQSADQPLADTFCGEFFLLWDWYYFGDFLFEAVLNM